MTTFAPQVRIKCGDALDLLRQEPPESVNCVVTSPPYWGLRDYGIPPTTWGDGWVGCLGLEPTPEMYVGHIVEVFREAWRLLSDDGTLWLNLGDSFSHNSPSGKQGSTGQRAARTFTAEGAGRHSSCLPNKNLIGIPWRVAFALQADGWYLRRDNIWHKPNPIPESVTDRTTSAHEYVFHLTKSERYWYDADAISEPSTHAGKTVRTNGADGMDDERGHHRTRDGFRRGVVVGNRRNSRSVWTIPTQPFPQAHFATMPEELVRRCILAGCPEGGTVLDPFGGSGTVGAVAARHGRNAVLFDLNPSYVEMARQRVYPETQPRLALDAAAGAT